MTTLSDIDKKTQQYADARDRLSEIVAGLNEGIEALKRAHMAEIKRALAKVAEHHDGLKALIEDAPELFVKPRSITVHGTKVGYQKGKGGIEFGNAEQVVRLIRKHLPEQAETLIKTTEAPVKAGLTQLSVTDLKRIGCTVVDADDEVIIKPADSEVDKLVNRLIAEATEEVPQ